MEIEILPRPAEEKTFTPKEGGEPRKYFEQWATITVDGLPTPFAFSTDTVLRPGPATLSPKSFGVMNGRLSMGRVVVLPLAPKAGPKPA
jgi:hypothetical protein